MLNIFTDLAPKAAVAAAIVWAGANYLVIGPEIATRIVRADHLPACERTIHSAAVRTAEARAAALPLPTVDAAKEMAAEQLRSIQDSPMMREFRQMGLEQMMGLDGAAAVAMAQYEQQKREATDAYNRALERIKQETATSLGAAGDRCGCLADTAIAGTRTEWAILTGTLGLIRPAPLKSFDQEIAQAQSTGRCQNGGEAGR